MRRNKKAAKRNERAKKAENKKKFLRLQYAGNNVVLKIISLRTTFLHPVKNKSETIKKKGYKSKTCANIPPKIGA